MTFCGQTDDVVLMPLNTNNRCSQVSWEENGHGVREDIYEKCAKCAVLPTRGYHTHVLCGFILVSSQTLIDVNAKTENEWKEKGQNKNIGKQV